MKIQETYDYESLIAHSPFIIVDTVDGGNNELKYEGMSFAITKVTVKDILRGDVPLESLNVLQTYSEGDPYLRKGKELLLFLNKYEGPIANDAFVINGLYQGQYELRHGEVFNVSDEKHVPINNIDIEIVVEDIRNSEYVPI